jgi:hypothetical protein
MGLHFFRQNAVWMVPVVALWHAMLTHGVSPRVGQASVVVAAISVPLGLGLRWFVKRTATVIAALIAAMAAFLYVLAIVTPISLLFLSKADYLLPLVGPIAIAIVGSCFAWRLVVSYRNDGLGPPDADEAVDVDADPLKQMRPSSDAAFWKVCGLLLATVVCTAVILRNHASYTVFAMVAGPIILALLITDMLARLVTFYRVFRRIEKRHGQPHVLPSLTARK